jgi:hypothetical protein
VWCWASLVVAAVLLAIPPGAAAPPPRATLAPTLRAPVALVLLVALGSPTLGERLPARAAELVASLRELRLNRIDLARVQRGYYEDLLNANAFHSHLLEAGEPPDDLPFIHTPAAVDSGDYRWKEMAPFAAMTYHGRPFHTNTWGMRDREYARTKPPRTYRIALLGASPEMGASVGDGETYEQLVEDRLNREHTPTSGWRYEILNFGVGQYSPIHRLMSLESEALPFAPDGVLYVAHPEDFAVEKDALARAFGEGKPRPTDPDLVALLERAGLRAGMGPAEVERRLAPRARELDELVLRKIAEICAARRIRAMWALLPTLGGIIAVKDSLVPRPPSGYAILDLSWVYGGHTTAELMNHPRDFHPNALGHRLIALRLYAELVREGLPREHR